MRSTIAEIKVDSIKHNIKMLRQFSPTTELIGVVKADAYGHGMIEIGKILRQEGIKILGVAFADEAVKLRQSGDNGEIFVLIPGTDYDSDLYCAYNLQSSVMDINVAKQLSDMAHDRNMKIKTHLYINSGMNRDGIAPNDAVNFMNECSKMEGIEMIGILTHFASSELEDKTFALKQLKVFNETIEKLKNAGYNFKYIHASNSGGIANLPEAHFNLARAGIAIYGYMDFTKLSEKLNLKPILTLKSKIINLNKIAPGDTVGYSLKYISSEKSRIAVVPLGYGDGYHRILSNRSECLINGKRYKIVGTICMDQCLIDVGDDEVEIGDEVVFIGQQGGDCITAYELAELAGTIPYEITTSLTWRVPRIYI